MFPHREQRLLQPTLGAPVTLDDVEFDDRERHAGLDPPSSHDGSCDARPPVQRLRDLHAPVRSGDAAALLGLPRCPDWRDHVSDRIRWHELHEPGFLQLRSLPNGELAGPDFYGSASIPYLRRMVPMTMKRVALIATVVGMAGLALLLWSTDHDAGSPSHLEGIAMGTPRHLEASPERIVRPMEADKRVSTDLPVDVSAQPPSPKPSSIGSNEVWHRIHGISSALFDGTARAEDVRAISTVLLSAIDLSSASKREDGVVEYRIAMDPALGVARLLVDPSRPNKLGEFMLEVDQERVSGYNGSPQDTEGSRMQILFGNDTDGSWGFTARIEDRLRTRDDAVWAGNAHAGLVPIGGSLMARGSDLHWQPRTAEAIVNPADNMPSWKINSGAENSRIVESGGFKSEDFASIQSSLDLLPRD